MPFMSRIAASLFLLVLISSSELSAQNALYFTQHRPAGLNWQELNSPHFRLIFAKGHEEIARRAARILENQYELSYDLTGGKLSRFPVVLAPYNDATNGFVSSVNFRSEVDISPFKGKALNPQSGSWLETVLPHELIHANHTNVSNRFSLASIIGLLGPDYRRSFNMFPPLGVHEGLAVYHESENGIRENSGRSNYTFFQNQFSANLAGPNSWNMGQTFIPSDFSLPSNRHYIGGSTFTKWLHESYGDDISKRAIRVHQNLFFLGYGYALKHVTGKWPNQLYQDYKSSKSAEEIERLLNVNSSTDDTQQFIGSPYIGVRQQRPIWISPDEILYFSRQYNAPGSIFIYNFSSNTHKKVSEHFLVGDFYMDFEKESDHIFLAENFSINRIFANYQSDIVRLNIRSGSLFRISDGDRLYAPEKSGSDFYALQPNGDISNIVKFHDGEAVSLTDFSDRSAIVVKASPHNKNELAVIVNQRGVQALWIVNKHSLQSDLENPPTLAFKNGSIHDPVWHPTKNRLLFTMDAFPAMNVYEFNLDDRRVYQLTNSKFNALEGSYSPDATSIVYVTQSDGERNIAYLHEKDFLNQEVDSAELLSGDDLSNALNTPFLGDELIGESQTWEISKYSRDFRWLKPRAVLPVSKDKSGTTEWGAALLSTDVLQSQLYALEVTNLQDRFWYNVSYTNKSFYPGFGVSAYSAPEFIRIRVSETDVPTFLQEERGFSLNSPIDYYFNKTDRFSSLFFRPSINREQLRFYNLSTKPVSDYSAQWKASLFSQLNIRILQRSRDIQPSAGVQFFGQVEKILNRSELPFTFNGEERVILLKKRQAYFYGVNFYSAIFPKTNQSLLLSAQFLNQTDSPLFSNNSIIPFGFEDKLFATSVSIGRFSSKYTIPLAYPDNGGLLVPIYVSNIYLSLFTHTLVNYRDLNNPTGSSSLIGAGLHLRYKISNLALDFGIGFTYDLSAKSTDFIFGTF